MFLVPHIIPELVFGQGGEPAMRNAGITDEVLEVHNAPVHVEEQVPPNLEVVSLGMLADGLLEVFGQPNMISGAVGHVERGGFDDIQGIASHLSLFQPVGRLLLRSTAPFPLAVNPVPGMKNEIWSAKFLSDTLDSACVPSPQFPLHSTYRLLTGIVLGDFIPPVRWSQTHMVT